MCGAFFNVNARQVSFRGTDDNMKNVASEKIKIIKAYDPEDLSHAYPEEFEMAMALPHVKISARGRCVFKSVNLFKESYLCAIVHIMYDGTKVVQFPQAPPVKTIVRWKKNKINALLILALIIINNLLLLALKKKRIIIISSAIYVTGFAAFGLGIKVLLSSLAIILLVSVAAVVLVITAEDILIKKIFIGETSQNYWWYIVAGSVVFYLSMIYYIFI